MSNVCPLHDGISAPERAPNESLVQALESLLEMARDGRLQSYIGTGFTQDGLRVSTWCDHHDDIYQMLGSLEWIKAEYVHRHTS